MKSYNNSVRVAISTLLIFIDEETKVLIATELKSDDALMSESIA